MATPSNREKARQIASQQKAQERRFKIALWGVVTAVALIAVIAVVATILNSDDALPVAEDQRVPESITATQAFQIPGPGNDSAEAVRVDYFFDPQCPACQAFSEQAGSTMKEHVKNGDIDLHIHPVSFMGGNTSNNYSGQAANAVVTVHEHNPEQTLEFLSAIFDAEFFPAGGPETRTSEELMAQAQDAGVPEETAALFNARHYFDWIEENTQQQMARDDLFPDGGFGTPAIFIGGEETEEGTLTGDITKLQFTRGSDAGQDLTDAIEAAQE